MPVCVEQDTGAAFWDRGVTLLEWQSHCWARDASAPSGDLLIQYGFMRRDAPEREAGLCRYRWSQPPLLLHLWPWGLAASAPHGAAILVRRGHFVPEWVECSGLLDEVWTQADLPRLRPADDRRRRQCSRRTLRYLLRFLAQYEKWIGETQGPAYRSQMLCHLSRDPDWPGGLVEEWKRLSWHVPDLPICSSGFHPGV